ncbi:MAG: phage capsid protein [Acidimicrobiia bacterium]|nr:phage capsid protein [Acidimicrobiia bacterium]
MSVSIPNWMIQQFSANVHELSEQTMSKLLSAVEEEPDFGSEAKAVERIGTTQDKPDQITTRHGETPVGNTEHSRRWIFPIDYDVPADLIDNQDKVKLLIDPTSHYTRRHANVMARGIDDSIVGALGGSAAQGQYGPNGQATSVALPAAQKIASGSVGLTIAKLIEAREILDENDVDEMWRRYIVCTPQQISNLLEDEKLSSIDFNTVKALVKGEINEYMGFDFKRLSSARLPLISSGPAVRPNYVWAQPAVRIGFTIHPTTSVDKRPDLRNSMQVYTTGSWGSVRVEDEMVVEIACEEA